MTAVVVASALVMQNLDSSAVATALPAMARDLGEEPAHLSAAITAYLVSLAVLIPASGWVADRFGARRVFVAAMVVFAGASALCGLAGSLAELVAARILQGAGGAMMVPVARLLLLRRVAPEEVIRATTWLTMPGLLGPMLGPPLGGLLTDAVSWRAVFWMNVPVPALGVVAVLLLLPRVEPTRPAPPDGPGLALLGGAIALLLFAAETLGRGIVPGWATGAAAALGLLLGWRALRRAGRVPVPAVDLALLRLPAFSVSAGAGTAFRLGAGAAPFLVPLSLQLGFGASASTAGLVTLATALGAFAMKPLARPVLRAFGFRRVILGNAVLVALSLAACALFTPLWPLWGVFLVLAAGGLARSLQFTALNALAYAELPPNKLSAGTSLQATLQQVSMALGVTWGAAALSLSAAWLGEGAPGPAAFSLAFLGAALPVLLSVPLAARLPPGAGSAASGHRG